MKNFLKKIFQKEKVGITGIVTIRAYKAGTKELVQEIVQKNLIMVGANTGIDLIVQRLIGTNTYTLNINYAGIGTSNTAVNVADVKLTAETVRQPLAYSADLTHNTALLQFFFSDTTLPNGTYKEFGMFIDGTAVADSGKIFNHALFGTPYVKTTGVDTTVEVDIAFA